MEYKNKKARDMLQACTEPMEKGCKMKKNKISEEEVKQQEVQPEGQPEAKKLSAAEVQKRAAEEAKEYKKYIQNLTANVERMRLEVEEMELFIRADELKRELIKVQQRQQEEAEQRRKDALELAEKMKKENEKKVEVVKQGKARE